MNEVTVPIIVDSVKRSKDFSFSRCIYYAASMEEESDTGEIWHASLADLDVPVLMAGFTGIVTRPLDADTFETAKAVEETFDMIEKEDRFCVITMDLWMPNFMLISAASVEEIDRGMVFRIGLDLFRAAIQYSRGQIHQQDFLAECENHKNQVLYSWLETEAFQAWAQMQVDLAKKSYPADPALALEWREDIET